MKKPRQERVAGDDGIKHSCLSLRHRWTGEIHNVIIDAKQGSYTSAVRYVDTIVKGPPPPFTVVKPGQKLEKVVRRCLEMQRANTQGSNDCGEMARNDVH